MLRIKLEKSLTRAKSFALFLLRTWLVIMEIFALTFVPEIYAESVLELTEPLQSAAINNTEKALAQSRKAINQVQPAELKTLTIDPAQQQRALDESAALINRTYQPSWRIPSSQSPSIFGNTVNVPSVNISALSQSGLGLHAKQSAGDGRRYNATIFVFVSSSMPIATIRNYIEQVAAVKGAVVLRGLIGESLLDTREYLYRVIGQEEAAVIDPAVVAGIDPNDTEALAEAAGIDVQDPRDIQILIDPTLFARFQVQDVPTLVVTEAPIKPCNDTVCEPPLHHRVRGDVSLAWSLDLVSRQSASDSLKTELRPLVKQLRGGKS